MFRKARAKKIAPIRKRELLQQLSEYIEAHYEGYSYRTAYHFDDEPVASQTPELLLEQGPRFSFDEEPLDASIEEDDPFDDIFHIFDRQKSDERTVLREVQIKRLIEQAEQAETFTAYMLRMIREKDLREKDVYHSVFMDRKLFNKIRNDPDYRPSKRTALLLSIALKLSIVQTREFLEKAGYTFSRCSKTDVIVEFFLLHENYNIFEINEMLDAFGLPLLMKCD